MKKKMKLPFGIPEDNLNYTVGRGHKQSDIPGSRLRHMGSQDRHEDPMTSVFIGLLRTYTGKKVRWGFFINIFDVSRFLPGEGKKDNFFRDQFDLSDLANLSGRMLTVYLWWNWNIQKTQNSNICTIYKVIQNWKSTFMGKNIFQLSCVRWAYTI